MKRPWAEYRGPEEGRADVTLAPPPPPGRCAHVVEQQQQLQHQQQRSARTSMDGEAARAARRRHSEPDSTAIRGRERHTQARQHAGAAR